MPATPAPPNHALVYLERGLKAKHANLLFQPKDVVVADEQEILGGDGHETTRSVIAAAYCVTGQAGGDQSKKASRSLQLIRKGVDFVSLSARDTSEGGDHVRE